MLSRLTSLGEQLLSSANSKPPATPSVPLFYTDLIKRLEDLIALIRKEYSLQPRSVVRGKDTYIDDPFKKHIYGKFLYEFLQTVKNHHHLTNNPIISYEQYIDAIDAIRRAPQYAKIQGKLEALNDSIFNDMKTPKSKGGGNFHYIDIDYKAAFVILQDLMRTDSEKAPSGEMLWRVCLGLKRAEGHAFVTNNGELIAKIRQIPSFQAHEPMDDRRLSSIVIEDPWLFAFFTKKQLFDFFVGCSDDVIAALQRKQNLQSVYHFSDEAHEIGSSLFSSLTNESSEAMRFPTLSNKELNTKTLVNFLVNKGVVPYTQYAINELVASREFIFHCGFHSEFFPVLTPVTLVKLFKLLDTCAFAKAVELKEKAARAAALREKAVKALRENVQQIGRDINISIGAAEIRDFIEFKYILTRIEKDLENGVGSHVYFSQNKEDPKIPYLLYELVFRGTILQFPQDKLRQLFNNIAPVLFIETLRLFDPHDSLHCYIEIGDNKNKERYAVDKSNQVSFSRLMQLLLSDEFRHLRQKWAEDEFCMEMFFAYPILLKDINFQQIKMIMAKDQDVILASINRAQKEGSDAVEACPLLLAFLPYWEIIKCYNSNPKIKQLFVDKTLPAEVATHWLKNNVFHLIAANILELQSYLTTDYFNRIDKILLDKQLLCSMMNNETTESVLMRHPAIIDAFDQDVVSHVAKESDFLRTVVRRNTGVKLVLRASVNFATLCEFMQKDDPIELFDNIAIFADVNKSAFDVCPLLLAFLSPNQLAEFYHQHEKIKQRFVDRALPAEVIIHYIKNKKFEKILEKIPVLADYLNLEFFADVNKALLDEQLLSAMLDTQHTKNLLKRYPSILHAFSEDALNNCAKDSVFLRQVARQAVLIELILANFNDLMSKGGRFTLFKKMIEVLFLNPETEEIIRRVEEELAKARAELESKYDKDTEAELIAYGKKQLSLDTAPYSVANDFQEHDSLSNIRVHLHKVTEMKQAIIEEVQQTFGAGLDAEEEALEKAKQIKITVEKNINHKPTIAQVEITQLKESIQHQKDKIKQQKEKLEAMIKPRISVNSLLKQKIIVVDPIILLISDMISAYPYWASQFIKSPGFYPVLNQFCINALYFEGDNIKRTGDHFQALYEYAIIFIKIKEYENAAKLLMEYVTCLGLDVLLPKKQQNAFQLLLNCAANLVSEKPLVALNYIIFISHAWPEVNCLDLVRLPTEMRHKAMQSLFSEAILFAENALSLFSNDFLSKKESMPMIISLYELLCRGVPLINHRTPEIIDLAARHQSVLASLRMLMTDNSNLNKTLNLYKDVELQTIFTRIQQRLQNIESEQTEQHTKRDSDENKLIERKRVTQFSQQTSNKIKEELDELAIGLVLNLHKRPLPNGKNRASTYVNKIKSRQLTPDITPDVQKPTDTPPRRATFSNPLDWRALESARRTFDRNSQTGVVIEPTEPHAEEVKLAKEREDMISRIQVVLSSDEESENEQESAEENCFALVPPNDAQHVILVPPENQGGAKNDTQSVERSEVPIAYAVPEAESDWQQRMNNEIKNIKVVADANQMPENSVDENHASVAADEKHRLEEYQKQMEEIERAKEQAETEEKRKLAEDIEKAKKREAERNKKLNEKAKQTKADEVKLKKEALALKKQKIADEEVRRKEAEAARLEQERIAQQKKLEQEVQEKQLAEERRKKEAEEARIKQEKMLALQKTEEGRRKLAEEEKKRKEAEDHEAHKKRVAEFKNKIAEEDRRKKDMEEKRIKDLEEKIRLRREQEAQRESERSASEVKVLEDNKAKEVEEAQKKEERQKALAAEEARRKEEEHQKALDEEARIKREERLRTFNLEAQRLSIEGRKLAEEERQLQEELQRIEAAKAAASKNKEEVHILAEAEQTNIVSKDAKPVDPNKEKSKIIATDLMQTITDDKPLNNKAFAVARKLSVGSQEELLNPLHNIGIFAKPAAQPALTTASQQTIDTDIPPPPPSIDNAPAVARLMTGAVKQAAEEAQRKEVEREARRKQLAEKIARRRSSSQPPKMGAANACDATSSTSEVDNSPEYKLFIAAQLEAAETAKKEPSQNQADKRQLRKSTSFTANYQRLATYDAQQIESSAVMQTVATPSIVAVPQTQRLQRSQSYGQLAASLYANNVTENTSSTSDSKKNVEQPVSNLSNASFKPTTLKRK